MIIRPVKFIENENENKNASGGTCARGAKRPRVGVFTRCVFVFVFVLIYVEFDLLRNFTFLTRCSVAVEFN